MKRLLLLLLLASPAFAQTHTFPALDTNNAFTGINVFTGKSSLANTSNSVLFVDDKTTGALYPTCQSAVTAAGSRPTIIIEAGDYSGADCTLPVPNNIVLFSMNGTTEYTNGVNWLYTSSGQTASYMHVKMQRSTIGASGANVAGYFTNTLNGYTQVSGVGADGSSSEMNTTGTFSGTLPVLQGAEMNFTNSSLLGTVSTWVGAVGYGNSSIGSTTAMTTVYGLWGKGCNSMLGAIPVNCYGLYGSAQAFGSSRKYSIGLEGQGLLLWDASKGAAGFDAEDNAHGVHPFIFIDNGSPSQTNIQAVTTAGLALLASNAATQMVIQNNSVNFFAAPTPQSAAFVGLGKTALPWADAWFGTAATNNYHFTFGATAAARTVAVTDPLGNVNLPFTIASGTSAMTTALIATVACGTTVTTAATGVLTTDSIDWSVNAAVTAANNGLLILKAWPTAGNVNFNYCNPTAAGLTPTATTVNWSVRRP